MRKYIGSRPPGFVAFRPKDEYGFVLIDAANIDALFQFPEDNHLIITDGDPEDRMTFGTLVAGKIGEKEFRFKVENDWEDVVGDLSVALKEKWEMAMGDAEDIQRVVKN